jgi:DNA modification methylase
LGDCREVLPTLGKVDAVVTDPPYGIKADAGFSGSGDYGARRAYEPGWDDTRPPGEVFEAILRVSDQHIVWGGQFFTDLLPPKGKWLFWDKCQTMPTYGDGELAWTSISGNSVKKFVYNGCGAMAKEKGRVHPTQKPVQLMCWCLDFLKDGTRSILDPFMGVGSTGVACRERKMAFIGIEREPKYFDTACKRIEEAQKQGQLF